MERRQDRRASPFVLRGQITAVALRGHTGMGRGGDLFLLTQTETNKRMGVENKKKESKL